MVYFVMIGCYGMAFEYTGQLEYYICGTMQVLVQN